ncbi:MAG: FAD-binding oxidoreductase [Betaproteobacteria bacterium]
MSLGAALSRWRRALPAGAVVTDRAALARAERATFACERRISAILRVRGVREVRAVARIAALTRQPIYPISRGRNWGLGSRLPAADGCALLDLSALNRILSYDATFGALTVQPGVSFAQAAAYLKRRQSPYFCSVPGGSPQGSLIGNLLERGAGDGPCGERATHVAALEAVLSTGETVRTGFARFARAAAAKLAVAGPGPSLAPLLCQSNFGIVTRATVWLARRPPVLRAVRCRIASTDALGPAIDALRGLLQSGVVHPHCVTLWNSYKLAARAGRDPWQLTQGRTPLSLRHRYGAEHWHAALYVYAASEPIARALVAAVRGALQPHAQAWTEARLETLPPDERALAEPGNPSSANLASMYWRKKAHPAAAEADPERDRCGVIWLCPALPLAGASAAPVLAQLERRILARGFEPNLGMNPASARLLDVYASLMYDRDVPGEDERAMRCHDELLAWLAARGHLPSRLGIQSMHLLPPPADDSARVLRRIKRAFDPRAVIAPGRYLPEE